MKKLITALVAAIGFACLSPPIAQAQCNGQFPSRTLCGNSAVTQGTPRSGPISSFVGVTSVLDYGAVGNSDGTTGSGTDNTAAIQTALNATQATGSYLYFPCGTYRITASLTGNTTGGLYYLKGNGYCSKIYLDAVTNIPALTFGPPAPCSVAIFPCVIIDGLNFVAPTTVGSSANRVLTIFNNQMFVFTNNWVNGYYAGIIATTSYGAKITHNTLTNIKSVAIFSPAGDATFNVGAISGNRIFSNGLTTNDAAVSIGDSNGGLEITNNELEANYGAFIFSGTTSGVRFVSNYMEQQTGFDAFWSGNSRNWSIAGNRFGSAVTTAWALLTDSNIGQNTISAGTITCTAATATGNWVSPQRVEGGGSFTCNDGAATTITRYSGALSLLRVRANGTAPALTSCGTTPAITGSDLAGEVTMGTGSPTGCVITFNVSYTSAPYCTVTWQATPLAAQSFVVAADKITLTQTGTSSNKVTYNCIARSGG